MFSVMNPASLFTCHKGQFVLGQPSPRIWSSAVAQAMSPDGHGSGVWAGDDFTKLGAVAAATSANANFGGYATYSDTGCGVRPKAASTPRAQIYLDNTDNDEAWLSSGGNVAGLGQISNASTTSAKWTAFETAFSVSSLTHARNVLVGMSTAGTAVADTIADDASLATTLDFVGFHIPESDPDGVDFIYKAASQSAQTVKADAHVFTAADTLVNLGWVYDPKAPPSQRISWYLNGEKQGTYITQTAIDAATFPEEIYLAFLAGLKAGGTNATSIDVKFWLFHQAA